MASTIDRIHALNAECVELWKYINCLHRIFGSYVEADARDQDQRKKQLEIRVKQLQVSQERDADIQIINAFEQEKTIAIKTKELWRQGPFPILCDEATLEKLALRVQHGPPVILTKPEIETYFDFSKAILFWEWIPDYTTIWFAFGMHWAYPDADLFGTMTYFHDKSAHAIQDVQSTLLEMISGRDARANLFQSQQMKKLYTCQTIVNACLLVEAFMNGLASVALKRKAESFSKHDQLDLQEQKEEKGIIKQKFVRIEDKMVEWLKLISPRKIGLNRGEAPYQDFKKILKLRHAIVHLSAAKVETYESLGHIEATQAADATVTVTVIREICMCLAVDPAQPQYPGWLKDRGPDGLFNHI